MTKISCSVTVSSIRDLFRIKQRGNNVNGDIICPSSVQQIIKSHGQPRRRYSTAFLESKACSSQYKWHLKVNCLTKFNLRGIVSFPFTIETVASQRAKTHLDYSSHLRSSISPLTHLTGNKFVATASSPSHKSPNQIKHTGFR